MTPLQAQVPYIEKTTQTIFVVISDGQYRLNTFSEAGSVHPIPYNGEQIEFVMQYGGGVGGGRKYAGPVVLYRQGENFWLRPKYEFDELFEKVTE